LNKDFNIS